ncbi:hypothetical protein PIB30_092576, partial [Stylosanthes scabra]|nr:hypothetical protein [Stylosanthes scabra]
GLDERFSVIKFQLLLHDSLPGHPRYLDGPVTTTNPGQAIRVPLSCHEALLRSRLPLHQMLQVVIGLQELGYTQVQDWA